MLLCHALRGIIVGEARNDTTCHWAPAPDVDGMLVELLQSSFCILIGLPLSIAMNITKSSPLGSCEELSTKQ